MRVLGIESSCDETAAAVVEGEGLEAVRLLSNVVRDQIAEHAPFGGVVPEVASRAHVRHIGLVVKAALQKAGLGPGELDGLAVTLGPGLIGGLLVGLSTAQGLAMATGLPLVAIHHMEGHLVSPFLQPENDFRGFPFVALLVSGGHTLLVLAQRFGEYRLLGRTRDDAVGEAFDKGARVLGVGYPGGPAIARLALGGRVDAVPFPRVLLDKAGCDFSFSGLKTSLRVFMERLQQTPRPDLSLGDIAASYQEAIVDTLVEKSLTACRRCEVNTLLVAGGVGANVRLREKLTAAGERFGLRIGYPPLNLCTDNGAMVALAGLQRLKLGQGQRVASLSLDARPRWSLEEI
ncbi:MAG: tRNA (adenosine(37)-N6)-threonylcarbamoyltransferase complex transferase subunit TsaD [Magnetococcales bacterium]|nr:tRNA (adenosine(37)-N6)-threonylcarbamoyltransferase complex transferase subunit TsaD [Magnetococcales bacterium]